MTSETLENPAVKPEDAIADEELDRIGETLKNIFDNVKSTDQVNPLYEVIALLYDEVIRLREFIVEKVESNKAVYKVAIAKQETRMAHFEQALRRLTVANAKLSVSLSDAFDFCATKVEHDQIEGFLDSLNEKVESSTHVKTYANELFNAAMGRINAESQSS